MPQTRRKTKKNFYVCVKYPDLMDQRQSLLARVQQYIVRHIPLSSGQLVLVGLSGGADSVALLSILTTLGYRCEACHCNFQLRGEESLRDRRFAENVAAEVGVPFREITFDTMAYAAANKVSVEMACRELRYEWFEQQRRESGAAYVAVAHHRDDSIETMLLNLIRGTGIAGLTGIQPVNGTIIRPLLSLSRAEIEAYLFEAHLTYVVDSTNRETLYTRNKIRLQLLPLMQTINPSVYESLSRTADYLCEVEALYRTAVDTYKKQVVSNGDDGVHIHIESLRSLPGARTILFEIIKDYGFLSSQLDDIWAAVDAPSGRFFDAPVYRLLKDRNDFVLYQRRSTQKIRIIEYGTFTVDEPVRLTLTLRDAVGYEIPRRPDTACFDAGLLPFPLVLRTWREGDKFKPFGMKGHQKLSDYFNNHKYTLARKQSTWLLCAGEEIVWIVGERSSDSYKVTPSTRQIWEIKCEK